MVKYFFGVQCLWNNNFMALRTNISQIQHFCHCTNISMNSQVLHTTEMVYSSFGMELVVGL